MPNRSRKKQGPPDFAETAYRVFQEAIGETAKTDPDEGKDPAAVALGRKGGKKGGAARAAKMTPEERSESAKKAAQARWAKKD